MSIFQKLIASIFIGLFLFMFYSPVRNINADVSPKKNVVIRLTLNGNKWPIADNTNPHPPANLLPVIIYCSRGSMDDESDKVDEKYLALLPRVLGCNYVSAGSDPNNFDEVPLDYVVGEHYLSSLPDKFLIGVMVDNTGWDGFDDYKVYVSDWQQLTDQMSYEYVFNINITEEEIEAEIQNNLKSVTQSTSAMQKSEARPTLVQNPERNTKSSFSATQNVKRKFISIYKYNKHELLLAVLITVIAESLAVLLYSVLRKLKIQKLLLTLIIVNIFTVIMLWYFKIFMDVNIYILEFAVVIFEGLAYVFINKLKYKEAFLVSLFANSTSYLLGLIIPKLLLYLWITI